MVLAMSHKAAEIRLQSSGSSVTGEQEETGVLLLIRSLASL